MFRELFTENRSAVVDAVVALGYPRAEAEADIPRPRPSSSLVSADSTALAFALWPFLDVGRAAGETGWGNTDQLYDIFEAVPIGDAAALRAWFMDRLASVWPQGTANAHGRQLWWFASGIRSGEDASAVFVQYVFQGRDEPEPLAHGASSVQEAAAAILGSEASPIELPGIAITARPSSTRSALWYLVWAAVLASIGASAYGLWWYNRKYGRMPWQGRA
jgi:hypothetical protein